MLGFTSVVGILVGTVIGSGIFVAPNRIASLVESPQLIMAVWIVGGILSFFGALAFAELGAAYPQAGGMYVYLREGYGPADRVPVRVDAVPRDRLGRDCHAVGGVLDAIPAVLRSAVAARRRSWWRSR